MRIELICIITIGIMQLACSGKVSSGKDGPMNHATPPANAEASASVPASSAVVAGLQLTASSNVARLSLTWKNVGSAPLEVATHVFAGENHYDWLKVTLIAGGKARTLTFRENRDESAPIYVTLAPGATTTEVVDLAAWAVRPPNGSNPLSSGRYTAQIVYDTSHQQRGWTGRIEVTIPLDIP